MRISDWSSDVCSSDLSRVSRGNRTPAATTPVVTLGLVPRAHSAAAPSPSTEVRRLVRAWIAGTSPAMTVLERGVKAVLTDSGRAEQQELHAGGDASEGAELLDGLVGLQRQDRKSTRL